MTVVPNSPNRITQAIQHLRAGRLGEAEALCRQVMAEAPDDAQALHLLGVIACQCTRFDEALVLFERTIAIDGADAAFHNSRGSLLYQLDRLAEAEPSFRRAVELAGGHPDTHNNLGNTLRGLGRLDEAESCFRQALALRPGYAELHNNLGTTLREQGRVGEATASFRQALALKPDYLDACCNLGTVLFEQMQLAEAEQSFRRVIAGAPAFIPAYVGLAHVLHSEHRLDEAIEVLLHGLEIAPGHPLLVFAARLVHSAAIPGWHLPMINDHERNEAYEKSLARAVTIDSTVLEIGTGSALVAMMAARAGARHVTTCEVNQPLARVARETVALNGFADRITVVPKLSTQLEIGTDMAERADVLVSELVNIGMLSPNMLAILQHARTMLLKPDARIIPAAATVYGMLVEAEELGRSNPVGTVCGFDMSRFDVFRSPGYAQVDLAVDEHRPLSEPFTALDFDFCRSMAESGRRELSVAVAHDGLCHGIAFWFDLLMSEGVIYSSASRQRTNHWKQALHFFEEPIPVKAGTRLTLAACYDNNRIYFELI